MCSAVVQGHIRATVCVRHRRWLILGRWWPTL
jgi:hypothetical protein